MNETSRRTVRRAGVMAALIAISAFRGVPGWSQTVGTQAIVTAQTGAAQQWYSEQIQRHKLYVSENGDDLPEIKNWRWPKS